MKFEPPPPRTVTTEIRVPAASPWFAGPRLGGMVRRLSRAPYLVLALSLLLTAAATAFVILTGRSRDEARVQSAVRLVADRVSSRMATYVAMLRGARGLFAASGEVTRSEFERYVEQLDVRRRYPGIQGIGYAIALPPAHPESLVAAARAAGIAGFRIWPDSIAASTAIYFLEPPDRRNHLALGFDMMSNPVRRAAMERARDTGLPAMSGRVRLVQEPASGSQSGVLIYFPLYRGESPPSTTDARRAALTGFVYSPFRTGDLFRNLFSGSPALHASVRVHDGPVAAGTLLYDSRTDGPAERGRGGPERATTVQIAGREWTLVVSPLDTYGDRSWPLLAGLIAGLGMLVSWALFAMTRAQVRARAAAEENQHARARFFAAMSHELRTPLNAIIGYNDLLLAGVYGPLSQPQEQGIDRSQKAARHLLELVNDVLDVSKFEAGKVEVVVQEVALHALIEDLFVTIRPMAESWGCNLRMETCECSATIRTDPRRVRQILLNLLSNATKFGSGRPVTVRCYTSGARAAVEVVDAGPGISPENLRRIFDEFVQLPSASNGGTGLGLAISRRLARLLGGHLEVDSVVGHGSTFRLVLPRQPVALPADGSPAPGRALAVTS